MKKLISRCVLLLALASLLLSAWHLIPYWQASREASATHEELARFHASGDPAFVSRIPANDHNDNQEGGDTAALLSQTLSSSTVQIDESANPRPSPLALLNAGNLDCVAWLSIEGTAIDYPVMFRPDDRDYYLHRDFYGNESKSGSLYLAEICDLEKSDNLIVYGHNMKDGSMFAPLLNYREQSFCEAHPMIRLETLSGEADYEIIAVLTTKVYTGHDFAFYSFASAGSEREFDAYVSACKGRALYEIPETAHYGDRLITLITCEYSQENGRFLVVARRVEMGGDS